MLLTQFLAIYTLYILPSSAGLLRRAITPTVAGLNLEEPASNLTVPSLFSPATNLSYAYKFKVPLADHNASLRATFFQDFRIPTSNIEDVLATVQQELSADVAAEGDGALLPNPLKTHSLNHGVPGCWFTTRAPSGPPSRFTYGILLEAVGQLSQSLPRYSYVMYAEVYKGRDALGDWIGSIILEDHAPAEIHVSMLSALEEIFWRIHNI